jgi:hypothetical protein
MEDKCEADGMGRRMVISDWQALLKLVKKGALISPKSEGRCLPCVSLVAPP